jgi:RNA polymerase sigma-70 factor (ECF subfamily)
MASVDTPMSLLERLRRPDDARAWDQFIHLYTPLLYHWARRAGLQEADAADLVQEVLLVLFRKLPEFNYDHQRSFRGWLRTVTLNKWRERQRRRDPLAAGNGAELAGVADASDMTEFEEAEYRRSVVQQALRVLQAEFPANTWKAFEEYVLADRPAEEVAAELRLRIGTVYAAKSRVLSRLRQYAAGLLD